MTTCRRLEGAVAVITGGASGIGAPFGRGALARRGVIGRLAEPAGR
jgi:NAD(P)-dependent dehydrogenase (short-subunit alcohol dehydrogenase family)